MSYRPKTRMEIVCSNQTRAKLDCLKLSQAAKSYLKTKKTSLYAITIAIVGQKHIQSLNRLYRLIDAPSDILTFTHRTPRGLVGEIYLNPQQASQKGYRLIELVRHGLNHCLGQHH